MAQFNVDSSQVAAAGAQAAAIAGQLRTDAAAMMAQVQSLQESWTGAAASSFADCATRWRAAQAQMEAALDSIAQALQATSASYEDAESGAAAMFAG